MQPALAAITGSKGPGSAGPAGVTCGYGRGRGQPAAERSQDGGDHQVEYTRAGQQFDADDRSGDDTGHCPGDQRLTRSYKLSRQSACQPCSAVLCPRLRRSVAC
jgi:hypothetical protein